MRAGPLVLLSVVAVAPAGSLVWAGCETDLQVLPAQPRPPGPGLPPMPPVDCDQAGLIAAVAGDCRDQVKALLAMGVSADEQDSRGVPAIHKAVEFRLPQVVELLLDAGADATAGYRGRSALCAGAYSVEMTRLFLDRGLLGRVESSCHYLRAYAGRGDAALLPRLIRSGFDVQAPDTDGVTPLRAAVDHENFPMIAALLEAGASPLGAWGAQRHSLLHGTGRTVTCLLLAHGADADATDLEGRTPLMWAAMLARAGSVEALVEAGAELDAQDVDGRTALLHALTGETRGHHDYASAEDKAAVGLYLLEAGADPAIRDRWGRDALGYAEEHELADAVRKLRR